MGHVLPAVNGVRLVSATRRPGRTKPRPELARAHLLYGEWLRREGRRSDARAQLRAAHEKLAAMGAEACAERARRELLAPGETARRRTMETASDLPRRSEWHLRKVFTKLRVSSRRDLAGAPANLGQGKLSAKEAAMEAASGPTLSQ